MTIDVLHTQGTKFWRAPGTIATPGTYAAIAGIIDAGGEPGKKRKTHDTTTLDQDGNDMRKIGSALVEHESVELEFLATETGLADLKTDMDSVDPKPYRITLRSGDGWNISGLVTSIKPSGKLDDLYKVKVTIEQAAAPTAYTAP